VCAVGQAAFGAAVLLVLREGGREGGKEEVDLETYHVTADGVHLRCAPLDKLPLAQRYFML